MTLKELGYDEKFDEFRKENNLEDFQVGRIVSEHKERYSVRAESGEFDAEITGNLRYSAFGREDFPAVGDWVALQAFDDGFAIIHKIFPRSSVISRRAVGKFGEIQIIATNIDYAFLVQAVDRDFNINRLERYFAISRSSKVEPIVVLTKIDLVSEPEVEDIVESVRKRIENVPVVAVSNETLAGLDAIKALFEPGKTYCMLGSSGVGKSTLLNNLSGKSVMKTGSISESTSKGRHVTTRRELIVLEGGGILIDNPGMREVGIADSSDGIEVVFDKIYEFAKNCKFADCTHTNETGCAVLEAVDSGEIDEKAHENYLKLEKEKAYFESTANERRKKGKDLAKIVKNYKKHKKRNRI